MDTPKLRGLLTDATDVFKPERASRLERVLAEVTTNRLLAVALTLLAAQVTATIAVYRVVKRSAQR